MFFWNYRRFRKSKKISPNGDMTSIIIQSNLFLTDHKNGDSIAVDGACLTITNLQDDLAYFDLSPETNNVCELLRVDKLVNLERAIKYNDMINGHLVTGHIDSVVSLEKIESISDNYILNLKLKNESLKNYIATKGSVALNGVSLTVNNVNNDCFSVNIVPYTYQNTNFHQLKVGMQLNIEVDIMARYIEKIISTKN